MYGYMYSKRNSNCSSTAIPLHSSPKSASIHLITSPSNDLDIYDFKYYLSYSRILKMRWMGLSNLCFDNFIKASSKCIKIGLVAPR